MNIDTRKKALASFLECEISDIETESLYKTRLFWGEWEYRVLTDEEADQACAQEISNSLWAFNASFIARMINMPETEEMIKEFQFKKCEDANPAILRLVGDKLSTLIKEAILSDGRGHFLATYDGQEHEVRVPARFGNEMVFIYRIN